MIQSVRPGVWRARALVRPGQAEEVSAGLRRQAVPGSFQGFLSNYLAHRAHCGPLGSRRSI